jgi:hypothetical protein
MLHFAYAAILIFLVFDRPDVTHSLILKAPVGLSSPYRPITLAPIGARRNICGARSLHMSISNDSSRGAAMSMDGFQNSSFIELDPSKRKAKAAALRTEASQLDEDASKLRDEALNLERKAAKRRIESWKMDGSISAVTNTVTTEDKYERQLAELDLMSEDYMDDPEKFESYRAQRLMLINMMGFQKEQEAKTNGEIKELKESLVDVQVVEIKNHICNSDHSYDQNDCAGSFQCSIRR